MNGNDKRAHAWLKISVLYFAFAVIVGAAMAASPAHDFRLMPVHAHLNLLGWVSMGLIGLLHLRFPALGDGKLAAVQFYSYQIGVPAMLLALSLFLTGTAGIEPIVGILSMIVVLSIVLFAVKFWRVCRA
jgi:hypothetical protein